MIFIIKKLCLKTVNSFKYLFKVQDTRWRSLLKYYDIPLSDFQYRKTQNSIYFEKLQITIASYRNSFVLESYKVILDLVDHGSGNLFIDNYEKVWIKINDILINIENVQEVFIVKEVFFNKVYQFSFPVNTVIIDVGANIGIASLFFGNNSNILKIYAFEPFIDTFKKYQLNLNANDKIKKKIISKNIGLGKCDQKLEVPYNYNKKGGMSTTHKYKYDTYEKMELVIIRSAYDEISKIISDNSENRIVIKLDCEGAEYEILETLFCNNVMKGIACIMLEYHFEGPERIISILDKSNFAHFYNQTSPGCGMIYAVNGLVFSDIFT